MEASLPCRSEAFEYYLAEGLAAFDQRVRACQIRGVDTAHRDLSGRSHTAGFDQARHLVQEHALFDTEGISAIRKSGLKRDQSSPASIMRMSVEMSAP